MEKQLIKIDGVAVEYLTNEIEIENSKAFGFIYVTKNLTNDRYYVGQSRLEKVHSQTKSNWKTYLGSGVELLEDIKTHGRDNFKKIILALAENQEQLTVLENVYIAKFKAIDKNNWYNKQAGTSINTAKIADSYMLRFKKTLPADMKLAREFSEFAKNSGLSKNTLLKEALRFYIDNHTIDTF